MFLRAGLVSLALLLASRVLGLLRESVQAAALGVSGLADVAVLMLTLPDLLTGILAAGALSSPRLLMASASEAWPEGRFDLVVVSEVGYFLSPRALDRMVDRLAEGLEDDGVVVLCHWRHRIEGWALDGSDVHERVARRLDLPLQATYADRDVEIRVHAREDAWTDPGR